MPVHDWSHIDDAIFDAFQLNWTVELSRRLNGGVLPDEYYALVGDHAGMTRGISIREFTGDRIVAYVGLIARCHVNTQEGIRTLVKATYGALSKGIHVLAVDLHPRGPRDRRTLHDLIWETLGEEPLEMPSNRPLLAVSYESGSSNGNAPALIAYVEPIAAGDAVPDLPVFLSLGLHVPIPLEATYNAAFSMLPDRWALIVTGKDR